MPVRPISQRSLLILPCRRAYVVALWTMVIGIVAGATAVISVAATGSIEWEWVGAAAVGLVLPRAAFAAWFETGIRCWNGGVRRFAAVLRRYVLWVCYYTIITAVGRGSAAPPRAMRAGTAWRSRGPNGERPLAAAVFANPPARWHQNLRLYARMMGNRWVLLLSPVVLLLDVLRDDAQDAAPPGSTYTLY
jgi:hypothetical protein